MNPIPTSAAGNLILRSLAPSEFRLLRPYLESLEMTQGMILGMPQAPLESVYFPVDAVISLAGATPDGLSVEVGMVGREGYLGLPLMFGKTTHLYQATVQHSGTAWRVSTIRLRDALNASPTLRERLLRYTTVRFVQLAQTAVCHRFHSLEQRLCRWLLSMQDRIGTGAIRLTHESLAQLIGGRRPTINTITARLKKSRILDSRRGSFAILDRARLEERACECYAVIAQEIAQSLPRLSSG